MCIYEKTDIVLYYSLSLMLLYSDLPNYYCMISTKF